MYTLTFIAHKVKLSVHINYKLNTEDKYFK